MRDLTIYTTSNTGLDILAAADRVNRQPLPPMVDPNPEESRRVRREHVAKCEALGVDPDDPFAAMIAGIA